MKIQNYRLYASNGKYIRIATKVILDDGREIKFIEKMSKKQAMKQLIDDSRRCYPLN